MFALVYTAGIVAKEFGRLYGYGLFATCVCIIFCECFTVREKVNTYRRRLGCFVFMSIMLFIAVADYVNREQALEVLKKTLKPAKDYFTIEITEDNLGKETPFY